MNSSEKISELIPADYSILVVDDNFTNLRVISDFLRETGFKVLIAQDGVSGIEKARYSLPDLILLDILMPGMDGFETCEQIKKDELLLEIPVIFMTALTETQEKIKGFQAGAVDYITKPFQAEEVIVRIKTQLNINRIKKQLESRNQQLEREIRDREIAEKALIESEARLITLINNLPFDFWALDGKFNFIIQNDKNVNNYGNLIGKNFEDVAIQNEPEKKWCEMREKVLSGKPHHWEYEVNKVDGSYQAFESFTIPVVVDNKTRGIVGVEIDVTERKKAEEELKVAYEEMENRVEERTAEIKNTNIKLEDEIAERINAEKKLIVAKEKAEEANRLKTEFLAQMSHEIRTPISTILNFTSLLQEEIAKKVDDEVMAFFPSIVSAGGRIILTIDAILNMSELHTGTYEPEIRKLDIAKDILDKLFAEFRVTARQKKLKFSIQYKTKNTFIEGDSYSIEQIFTNLIGNALKYTDKGSVVLKVYRVKSKLHVDVKDTGIGIGESVVREIFDPFRQEEQGYTRTHEGNGLGLALVKEYCKINNASVTVQSKKDQGSTFTVCF